MESLSVISVESVMINLKKLFSRPLPSTRGGVFYNTFPYQTKISPEAIAVYIAALTNPGDTVLDTFGGSGSTSIAALLCEHPTDYMKGLASDLGVTPNWGARNAISYELGTYASFAAKTLMNRLKAKDYCFAVDDFLSKAEGLLGSSYVAQDPQGGVGQIRYVIWSEVLQCPRCGQEFSYFDVGTRRSPVVFLEKFKCPHCDKITKVDACPAVTEVYFDQLIGKMCKRKKRIPVWVYGQTGKWKWDRKVDKTDIGLLRKIEDLGFDEDDAPREVQWGDLWRSGYHFGITHLHHFYTKRNYLAMYKLWRLASTYGARVSDALHLLLLSYNAAHCTIMTRVVAKKKSKDFILTSSQSGVLYVSRLPVEKNVLLGLKRKAKHFAEAYHVLEECTGRVLVHNTTSERLKEKSGSVDYVFTDPPFGDFIPYAEVNQINELWLPSVTDRRRELIISSSQGKDVGRYGQMLASVFSELGRVIKRKGFATVVFHAAKADVWNAFASSVSTSGMKILQTSILDKKQSSFKQVVSADSVQGDPMLLLQKSEMGRANRSQKSVDILEEVMSKNKGAALLDERRLYSAYVNACLKSGVSVEYDAKTAYRLIESKMGVRNRA